MILWDSESIVRLKILSGIWGRQLYLNEQNYFKKLLLFSGKGSHSFWNFLKNTNLNPFLDKIRLAIFKDKFDFEFFYLNSFIKSQWIWFWSLNPNAWREGLSCKLSSLVTDVWWNVPFKIFLELRELGSGFVSILFYNEQEILCLSNLKFSRLK